MVGAENRAPNGARSEGAVVDANRYFIDSLYRSGETSSANEDAVRAETSLIFAHSLRERELTAEDRNYIAGKVAATTGLSRPEAKSASRKFLSAISKRQTLPAKRLHILCIGCLSHFSWGRFRQALRRRLGENSAITCTHRRAERHGKITLRQWNEHKRS